RNESAQPLSVAVTSSNPALIPQPVVSYESPGDIGTLTFTPLADANTAAGGPVTLAVTMSDGQAPNNKVVQAFTVTVNPNNDQPTLDALNAVFVNEDAPAQTV